VRGLYLALQQGPASPGPADGAAPPLGLRGLACQPVAETPQPQLSAGARLAHVFHRADLARNREATT